MSQVLWSNVLVPPEEAPVEPQIYSVYDPPLVVEKTCALPQPTRQLAALPDRRAYRSLSRSGVLLCAVGLPANEQLAKVLDKDPYRVGMYCALDAGPQNYEACRDLLDVDESFATRFKKLNHPKRYLAQLVNLPAAQLGIFLGLRGPINVYAHSTAASCHALEQAELDLSTDVVDLALVCSAFTLEDPVLTQRIRKTVGDGPVISEGAVALLLAPGGECLKWGKHLASLPARPEMHGIADPLVAVAQKQQPQSNSLC